MTLDDFNDKYGDKGLGFIKPLSQFSKERKLIDSGSLTLNIAHGIGGIKTGCVIRIMGDAATGKTSLSLRIMSSCLSQGMSALYIDAEASLNEGILRDTLEDYGLDSDGDL